MPEDLKRFEAFFAEWTGPDFRIVTIGFFLEDEKDALEIAEDIALLEGTELIYLAKS
jgi:hypothetical protein